MAHIFISYSRKDRVFANKLAAALTSYGADVWIDIEDIPAGMKWSSAIQQGLDACDVMIVIISPDSMVSTNVADEWQYYLDNEKTLIPVLCRPAKVHFQLSRIQYVNFHDQEFDTVFTQLHSELRRKGVRLAPITKSDASVQITVQKLLPVVKDASRQTRRIWLFGAVIVLVFVLLAAWGDMLWSNTNTQTDTPHPLTQIAILAETATVEGWTYTPTTDLTSTYLDIETVVAMTDQAMVAERNASATDAVSVTPSFFDQHIVRTLNGIDAISMYSSEGYLTVPVGPVYLYAFGTGANVAGGYSKSQPYVFYRDILNYNSLQHGFIHNLVPVIPNGIGTPGWGHNIEQVLEDQVNAPPLLAYLDLSEEPQLAEQLALLLTEQEFLNISSGALSSNMEVSIFGRQFVNDAVWFLVDLQEWVYDHLPRINDNPALFWISAEYFKPTTYSELGMAIEVWMSDTSEVNGSLEYTEYTIPLQNTIPIITTLHSDVTLSTTAHDLASETATFGSGLSVRVLQLNSDGTQAFIEAYDESMQRYWGWVALDVFGDADIWMATLDPQGRHLLN